ncbi:hypothetical protein BB560_000802 [Smittium megazygosporum]|uniref:Uncharacterized protein n=1 Tax=Smittium megazygosporum TaxID=133381 RepID=A0A2T9ZJI8_9FUNG|nr:hypothetical protein BB560_000802 [Smittium megazygosporum]
MIQHSQTHSVNGRMFSACLITNEKSSVGAKRRPKEMKGSRVYPYKKNNKRNNVVKGNSIGFDQNERYRHFSLTLKPIAYCEESKKTGKKQSNVFRIVDGNTSPMSDPYTKDGDQKIMFDNISEFISY